MRNNIEISSKIIKFIISKICIHFTDIKMILKAKMCFKYEHDIRLNAVLSIDQVSSK